MVGHSQCGKGLQQQLLLLLLLLLPGVLFSSWQQTPQALQLQHDAMMSG
jgi:hypothetical protein